MLRIVFLVSDPYPKPFKIKLRLLLAFLTLNRSIKQASLFRGFALKKPPEYSGGFVAFLGNSLEDFVSDINSLMEIRIKIY